MDLFQLGDFLLNSGQRSKWKLECDALSDSDIEALADMIRQAVGSFSSVEGVPRGGLRLAEALRQHRATGAHLIVDDVLTTGGSLKRARDAYLARTPGGLTEPRPVDEYPIGAVIFARGPCPPWVTPLFQLPRILWLSPSSESQT